MARRKPEIFIVGQNIDKHEGYFGRRDGRLARISEGVYLPADADLVEAFRVYGFRIASIKFRDVAITHSCAWFKKPVDVWAVEEEKKRGAKKTLQSIDVFIGGSYVTQPMIIGADLIRPGQPSLRIIHSATYPKFDDPELYRQETFEDPLGKFKMFVSTPELTALQVISVYRKHAGKSVDNAQLEAIATLLLERHRGDPYVVASVIDRLSQRSTPAPTKPRKHLKDGEDSAISPFERFMKILFPLLRAQAG